MFFILLFVSFFSPPFYSHLSFFFTPLLIISFSFLKLSIYFSFFFSFSFFTSFNLPCKKKNKVSKEIYKQYGCWFGMNSSQYDYPLYDYKLTWLTWFMKNKLQFIEFSFKSYRKWLLWFYFPSTYYWKDSSWKVMIKKAEYFLSEFK